MSLEDDFKYSSSFSSQSGSDPLATDDPLLYLAEMFPDLPLEVIDLIIAQSAADASPQQLVDRCIDSAGHTGCSLRIVVPLSPTAFPPPPLPLTPSSAAFEMTSLAACHHDSCVVRSLCSSHHAATSRATQRPRSPAWPRARPPPCPPPCSSPLRHCSLARPRQRVGAS